MKKSEQRRRAAREMCSDLIQISLQDQRGHWVRETGLLEDVSLHGMCISLNIPITVGRLVHLHARGFRGEARVRSCELGDYSYLLGVEFSDGFEWDRKKWKPKHLLPVPGDDS